VRLKPQLHCSPSDLLVTVSLGRESPCVTRCVEFQADAWTQRFRAGLEFGAPGSLEVGLEFDRFAHLGHRGVEFEALLNLLREFAARAVVTHYSHLFDLRVLSHLE
jgi:hypothetical protein